MKKLNKQNILKVFNRDWPGFLIVLTALFVFIRTLCPSLYWWDSGELITAVKELGIPHPTGFPLYLLLGKLFTIPDFLSNTAVCVNFFSAIAGAVSLYWLFLINRNFLPTTLYPFARWIGYSLGLLGLAFTQIYWSQSVIAEIYTFNLFFIGSFVWTLVKVLSSESSTEQGKYLSFAAFILGLGLTVHAQMIICFPSFILILLYTRPWKSPEGRTWLTAIPGFFFLGFLVTLYLPIRSATHPVLHHGISLTTSKALWGYLSQAEFHEKVFNRSWIAVRYFIFETGKVFLMTFKPWGIALGLGGLAYIIRRKAIMASLPILIILTNIGMAVFYGHSEIIEPEFPSFLLPSIYLWGGLCSLGIYAIIRFGIWLAERLECPTYKIPLAVSWQWITFFILTGLWAWQVNSSWNVIKHISNGAPDRFGQILLKQLPDNSLVLVRSVYIDFNLLYQQQIKGERPKIEIVSINRQKINPSIITAALQKNRPVFAEYSLIQGNRWIVQAIPSGLWARITPEGISNEEFNYSYTSTMKWEQWVNELNPATEVSPYPVIIRDIHPFAQIRNNFSILAAERQDWNIAFNESIQASAYESEYVDPYLKRAIWANICRSPEMAVQEAKKALKLNPISHDAWISLGAAYATQNQFLIAEKCFLKAVKIRPDSYEGWVNLYMLYSMTGETEAAEAAKTKANACRNKTK